MFIARDRAKIFSPLGSGVVTPERLRPCQNGERTGAPTRAARVGWWMRPDPSASHRTPNLPPASRVHQARSAGM